MNIGKTVADLFYWRSVNHLRLIVKNDIIHFTLDYLSPLFIIAAVTVLSVTLAPITAVLLSSLAIFSVVAFPILINYTIAATKIAFNKELFQELRKDGISFSRALDLFSCFNSTSLKPAVLKVLAESDLNLLEIQSLIKTKEQVDAINDTDSNGLKTLKLILNSDKFNDMDHQSVYFNDRRTKVKLLDTPEKINMIKPIDHYKLEVILKSDKFDKHDIKNLLKGQQVVNGINSINAEKLKLIVSTHSYSSIQDLLKDEQAVNGVNSISIEKLTLLFNSNNHTSHFDTSLYLRKSGFLKHITVDQFNLILKNFDILHDFFAPEATPEDIKYMDEEKFLILVKNRLPGTFHGYPQDLPLLSFLGSPGFTYGVNSLESAEELQTLVDNFRNDQDGHSAFADDIQQRYSANREENIAKLSSIDKNITDMLYKRLEVSKYFVDNTSAAQFTKILDNMKSNIVLANKIFYCEFLSKDDVINLYKNFDAKEIEKDFEFASVYLGDFDNDTRRNFRFVLALHKAGKIDKVDLDYLLDSTTMCNNVITHLNKYDEETCYLIRHILDNTFFDKKEQTEQQNNQKPVIPRLRDLCIEKLITEQGITQLNPANQVHEILAIF